MVHYIKGSRAILLICMISTVFALDLQGQQEGSKIETITFEGTEKSDNNYLIQFCHSKIGDYSSDSLLREDVQRLKNIPSVGDANYVFDTLSETLVFQIEETKTLLPIANFGGVKGNNWFQLGFYDSNWRGKGSFLSVIYQNTNMQHGGQIYYRVPRIGRSDWGFSATLNRQASLEPLFFDEGIVNYIYTNHEVGLTAIKTFDFGDQLEFGVTYFIENYKKTQSLLSDNLAPSALTQPKYLSKVEYSSNKLNYNFFYLKGFYWKVALQNVYTIADQSWFQSLQFCGKHFIPAGENGNFAMRLTAGLATNNDSPFAPYVVDSHDNLRGVGSRTARGTAQFFVNLEYRHTIHETKNGEYRQ